MNYFAIRHKPSGHFIPQIKSSQRNGNTYSEPGPGLPRLFTTRLAAHNALVWWLRGKYKVRYYTRRGDWFGEDDQLERTTEPVPSRKTEEMEIVEVELRVISP